MGDHITDQDYLHVFPGENESVVAGSEKVEDRVDEHHAEHREHNSCDAVETYVIRQNLVGGFIVLLAQQD